MKYIAIYIFKLVLKFIYFFLKLLPINKKKIVFMSRQSNELPLDFKLIKEELERRDKSIKMVFICKRINSSFLSKISYFFTIIRQMYHLATSKVVVLDSYCIPVSILNHKKELFVLQIWHSIGKIKKSGYQTLDTPSGRSSKMAKVMCMHKNYDAIVAGSPAFDKFYEEGFNVKRDILLHYGLPRIDYLINNEKQIKKDIYEKYPEFKNKKIVLYAPTFRTYKTDGIESIINNYNPKDFVLIVKCHANQMLDINSNQIYTCDDFKSVDLLSIADYVITDYSSIALEAAILNKKILFFVYDYERYNTQNGLNIDFKKLLPECSSIKINDLFKIINSDKYDNESYQKFRKKYLPEKLGKSTELITDFIITKLK